MCEMIPLAVPNLNGNEKKYLDHCIETTFVSSVGEYVNKFESVVAQATGSEYAVATSSGTTGLHAALTAVGVKHGDLVIIPTFTFIATANAVAHCGAMPWLVDIDPESWCMDVELVRREMRKNCKVQDGIVIHIPTGRRVAAIMPVYTLGNLPEIEKIKTLAELYGLPLVVDAACAIGAEYRGQKFGGFADLSVLSFNGNKTITCGGGGAIVGNKKDLLGLVRHITTTARVSPEYDFDMVGFNYRMTNIQAAVGVAQMERLNAFVARKREVRKYYECSLRDINGISFFPVPDGQNSSCWFSGIVLENGGPGNVKEICTDLKEKGIEARPFWKPIHLQKPYANMPCSGFEIADKLWGRIITLPCSTNITDSELEKVDRAVHEVLA